MEIDISGLDVASALGIPEEAGRGAGGRAAPQGHHRAGRREPSRKMRSEAALDAASPRWALGEGDCLHVLTRGDVDFASVIKFVVRQQRCPYLCISSWIMSGEDSGELAAWHDRGLVGRVDFLLGEIFESSYPESFQNIMRLSERCGGRVAIVRNHMKACAIEGERFCALIESSANVNTNPRAENFTITCSREVVAAWLDFVAGIAPYNRETRGAEAYRMGGRDA